MKNIFFVNPHHNLCGGNKIIFEYCNHLAAKYQKCFVVCNDLVPNWMPVNAFFINRADALKIMKPQDIIVFHWDFDANYVLKAPANNKYYLVQSFVHLKKNIFKMPFKFLAVSSYIQEDNKKNYNVESELLLNAIDHNIFYNQNLQRVKNRIFAIDRGSLKDVNSIKKAEKLLPKNLNIEFVYKDHLTPEEIAKEYNLATIYVSASLYEGFCLPVLEAFASGAVVITTDCKGIGDFATENFNCLHVPMKSPAAIASAILKLINNKNLQKKFQENGFEIAKKFTWENTINKLSLIFDLREKTPDSEIIKQLSEKFKIIKNHSTHETAPGRPLNIEKNRILREINLYNFGKKTIKLLDKLGLKYGTFDYKKINFVNSTTIYIP
ncbi:MAG: glycosyltransferase family 4 protein [Candidatus Margulisiibacteriota bacterium]|jgi:hypothetical protein